MRFNSLFIFLAFSFQSCCPNLDVTYILPENFRGYVTVFFGDLPNAENQMKGRNVEIIINNRGFGLVNGELYEEACTVNYLMKSDKGKIEVENYSYHSPSDDSRGIFIEIAGGVPCAPGQFSFLSFYVGSKSELADRETQINAIKDHSTYADLCP